MLQWSQATIPFCNFYKSVDALLKFSLSISYCFLQLVMSLGKVISILLHEVECWYMPMLHVCMNGPHVYLPMNIYTHVSMYYECQVAWVSYVHSLFSSTAGLGDNLGCT